jgi:hypothetical protein
MSDSRPHFKCPSGPLARMQAKSFKTYPTPFPPKEDHGRMCHIVTIQTKVHDPHAVAAACRRLNRAG